AIYDLNGDAETFLKKHTPAISYDDCRSEYTHDKRCRIGLEVDGFHATSVLLDTAHFRFVGTHSLGKKPKITVLEVEATPADGEDPDYNVVLIYKTDTVGFWHLRSYNGRLKSDG